MIQYSPLQNLSALQGSSPAGQALVRPGEMRRRAMKRLVQQGLQSNEPVSAEDRQAINQSYSASNMTPLNKMWQNVLSKYYQKRQSNGLGHFGGPGQTHTNAQATGFALRQGFNPYNIMQYQIYSEG